jgi:hypothetical protein
MMHPTVKTFLCALPIIILFAAAIIAFPQEFIDNLGSFGEDSMFSNSARGFDDMSYSELSLIAVQYDYKDSLRNIDDYSGKIIFVEGIVINAQRDTGQLNLCVDKKGYCSMSDDFMFVNVNGINTWLEDDKLSGYVEVQRLEEVFVSTMFTAGKSVSTGDYVPYVKEIKLRCSNC